MILKVDFRGRNAQFQGTGETVVLNTDVLYVNCTECKYYMLLKYILKDLKHKTAKNNNNKVSSSLIWWLLENEIVDTLRYLLAL